MVPPLFLFLLMHANKWFTPPRIVTWCSEVILVVNLLITTRYHWTKNSKIRMICLLIFENYSKIQNFSQLLIYLGRWVLITLIISKYYLLKGFLMPKLFKCVNRNTLLLKANISNMYKCTLYLNHQVTKSFVKDCWASDPQ